MHIGARLNYLSVCSGIEAATVAWHPLGWTPVAFAEIESFPRDVLAHHYPAVPNRGDMTRFQEWPDANLSLLVGGTPCQSFSVAGLRKGLADPRGNLTLTYLAIAARYRPQWLVWENVPGVLSDGDGAFWQFLDGLSELGYGWAWRVLDAQYFGVAQRRRRPFVVGYLGDWRRAGAVLFERESLSGNPAPRRESGERAAPSLAARTRGGGGLGTDAELDGALIPEVCGTLSDGAHNGGGLNGQDAYTGRIIPILEATARQGQTIGRESIGVGEPGDPMFTLQSSKQHAIAFNARQDPDSWEERTGPLDVDGGTQAVALRGRQGGATAELSVVPSALRASQGGGDKPHVLTAMKVRRLTPRECERLQGFPDDYTLIPRNGKLAADGPRYKALGNSMAVPVMRWIGERIQQVNELPLQGHSEGHK